MFYLDAVTAETQLRNVFITAVRVFNRLILDCLPLFDCLEPDCLEQYGIFRKASLNTYKIPTDTKS